MKILCICPIGIGNYLLMYPACRFLKSTHAGGELHLLALRGQIAELAAGDPLWSRVHCIDPTREKKIGRQVSFVRALSAEKFEASLSFFPSNTWQYNLLPFLCEIRSRFAFGYQLKKGASLSFLNNRLLPVDIEAHDVRQNMRLAALFADRSAPDVPHAFPSLFTAEEREAAGKSLHKAGGPALFVAVHPGSSAEHGMQAKRWDPMRFGELADRICNVLKAQALIFGTKEEEKIKLVTASLIKAPHRIIEPCSVRMTAALISGCALMLCNDSGLMHIAACMGVPTAAVFGPTDEKRNGPVGKGNLVLRKPMPDFPLWTAANVGVRVMKGGVDPMASLKALSVDEAWEKVMPWLCAVRDNRAQGAR